MDDVAQVGEGDSGQHGEGEPGPGAEQQEDLPRRGERAGRAEQPREHQRRPHRGHAPDTVRDGRGDDEADEHRGGRHRQGEPGRSGRHRERRRELRQQRLGKVDDREVGQPACREHEKNSAISARPRGDARDRARLREIEHRGHDRHSPALPLIS